MARLPRLYLPGCAQHIIQHGNNREACFYDEADYKAYLSFLKEGTAKYQVAIHAFVLMTYHVHLLATPADEKGISRLMQVQGRKYVQYFNFTYGRPVPYGKDAINRLWWMQILIFLRFIAIQN